MHVMRSELNWFRRIQIRDILDVTGMFRSGITCADVVGSVVLLIALQTKSNLSVNARYGNAIA